MINRMMLQGRLTKDIEVKKTTSDISRCEFTIAWSEKYKEVERKCFQRCVAWRSTADFLGKYFSKGQELAIEGPMITEEWEKDGQKQSRNVCTVDKVHFCGPKNATKSDQNAGAQIPDDFVNVPEQIDDELPFN